MAQFELTRDVFLDKIQKLGNGQDAKKFLFEFIKIADDNDQIKELVKKYKSLFTNEEEINFHYDGAPDNVTLKKEAATKRVLLGMENATEDELLGIIKASDTDENLRNYINGKNRFNDKLNTTPSPAAPVPALFTVDHIGDAEKEIIKKAALKKLFLKKLKDLDVGKYLGTSIPLLPFTIEGALGAADGGAAYLDFIKGIIFPAPPAPPAPPALIPDDYLTELQTEFKKQAGKQFILHQLVTCQLSEGNVNSIIAAQNVNEMRTAISTAAPALPVDVNLVIAEDNGLLNELKLACIKGYINHLGTADLEKLNAIEGASDLNALKAILNPPPPPAAPAGQPILLDGFGTIDPCDNIKELAKKRITTIKEDNLQNILNRVKTASFNSQHITNLIQIASEDKFPQLCNKMTAIFVNNPPPPPGHYEKWLDKENIAKIQKAAIDRALELKLAHFTLGEGARPELLKLMKNLPLKKQLELLAGDPGNDQDSRHNLFKHLVAAKDKFVIMHYAGISAEEKVTQAAEEAKKYVLYQEINNAELARILAKNQIPLDTSLIESINNALKRRFAPNAGINTDRLAALIAEKTKNSAISDQIKASITKIEALGATNLNLYEVDDGSRDLPESLKAFLPVLFNLKAHGCTYHTGPNIVDGVGTALKDNSDNYDAFIAAIANNCLTGPQDREPFKKVLKLQFSQEDFERIKGLHRKEVLGKFSTQDEIDNRATMIWKITSEFNELKKQVKPFLYVALEEPLSVEVIKGARFMEEARVNADKMKSKYNALLDEYSLTLDQLERKKAQFQRLRDSIPEPDLANPVRSNPLQMQKLRTELDTQIKTLGVQISSYADREARIIKTLKQIDSIKGEKLRSVYCDELDTTTEFISGSSTTPSSTTSSSARLTGALGTRTAAQIIKAEAFGDKTLEYSVTRSCPSKSGMVDVTGTYTQQYIGKENCEFVVTKQPVLKDVDNKEAVVAFNMNLAISMIQANGGKPPSKDHPIRLSGGSEQEMQALWTALYIVAKEKYGCSHAQIMEGLHIETGGFSPYEHAMTEPGMFTSAQFMENSLHTQLFKPMRHIVDAKLRSVDLMKDHVNKEAAEIARMSNPSFSFKSLFQATKLKDADAKAATEEIKNRGRIRAHDYVPPTKGIT